MAIGSLWTTTLVVLCTTAHGQNQQPIPNEELQSLEKSLQTLTDLHVEGAADAGIFHKGLKWALRYDQAFSPADVALLRKPQREDDSGWGYWRQERDRGAHAEESSYWATFRVSMTRCNPTD